jgi:hypothetical protein
LELVYVLLLVATSLGDWPFRSALALLLALAVPEVPIVEATRRRVAEVFE